MEKRYCFKKIAIYLQKKIGISKLDAFTQGSSA